MVVDTKSLCFVDVQEAPSDSLAPRYTIFHIGRAVSPRTHRRFHLHSRLILQLQRLSATGRATPAFNLWHPGIFHSKVANKIWPGVRLKPADVYASPFEWEGDDIKGQDTSGDSLPVAALRYEGRSGDGTICLEGGWIGRLVRHSETEFQCVWRNGTGGPRIMSSHASKDVLQIDMVKCGSEPFRVGWIGDEKIFLTNQAPDGIPYGELGLVFAACIIMASRK